MVAKLLLTAHHSEVVIVTGAEHALRHDLVLAFAAPHNPDGPTARVKLEPANLATFNQDECMLGPFLKGLG